MNKAELIDKVAERLEVSRKQAAEAVDEVIASITDAVAQGERVAITGFGIFEKVERKARTGRNPLTGAIVKIKATNVPKFRPGAEFKLVVSSGRATAARPSSRQRSVRSTTSSVSACGWGRRRATPTRSWSPGR